jgi:two-component system, response regulator PdtaR
MTLLALSRHLDPLTCFNKFRMDLVERLQQHGCHTIEAGSAQEAISILQERTDVTVVFADIQMPGTMDGIELAD